MANPAHKSKILLQIDTDEWASSFDSIVAIDSGVDQLLTYAGVEPTAVEGLVHGALFTRGVADLSSTALFLGGSRVEQVEQLWRRVSEVFFGPFQVSVMSDPNGSNTTAAAAILTALKEMSLADKRVVVLGGTGPVGSRIAGLAARLGAQVTIGTRRAERGWEVIRQLEVSWNDVPRHDSGVWAVAELTSPPIAMQTAARADVIFAAGAAGVAFFDDDWLNHAGEWQLALDVNAVPPLGLPGVEVTASGVDLGRQRRGYGALAIGGLKMKLHKACLRRLFETNSARLNTREIFAIGQEMVAATTPA